MTALVRRTDWFLDAPLRPPERMRDFGPTLVIAPHPDDEALGCGGTIALLRQAGLPVRVIIASDGAASHPGSTAYLPATLAALRRAESEAGLGKLGVAPEEVTFLGLPDGAVPQPGTPAGQQAVASATAALQRWTGFQTALLPWRRDPHPDHRATWAIFTAALDGMRSRAPRFEYPIWSRVHPGPNDLPDRDECSVWRYDIEGAQRQKRAAILAHRSQTTEMIDDAEIGACLTPDVLERFFVPWEPLIEVRVSTHRAQTVTP